MKFKNLSIKIKIGLMFAIMSCIALIVSFTLSRGITKIQGSLEGITDSSIPHLVTVTEIRADFISLRKEQFVYIANINDPLMDTWLANFAQLTSLLLSIRPLSI